MMNRAFIFTKMEVLLTLTAITLINMDMTSLEDTMMRVTITIRLRPKNNKKCLSQPKRDLPNPTKDTKNRTMIISMTIINIMKMRANTHTRNEMQITTTNTPKGKPPTVISVGLPMNRRIMRMKMNMNIT